MTILVTGASGFIGKNLSMSLAAAGHQVVGALRSGSRYPMVHDSIEIKRVKSVDGNADWSGFFENVSAVVHCAAVAHGKPGDVSAVNIDGTLNLARQAASAGVRRFVFLSSIGVNGNGKGTPYTEADPPNPDNQYAQSKWAAEQALWSLQQETGLEVVVVRPPLVYGPDAPGNFGALVRWLAKGVPLPLGAVHNKRSFIAIDNLVDLLTVCISHNDAANQVFLAGDGQDLSTTELLRGVSHAMGKPARLIPVPSRALMLMLTMLGKKAMAQQLLGSLQVDISKARKLLEWQPPLSVEEALKRCFPDH
jgi:UDP-N-acetyl-alpha-D-quinovosamine dehydrogenase